MAECSWCGKKTGFFSGEVMQFGMICDKCYDLHMQAKIGNVEHLNVLNEYKDKVVDERAKEYLINLISEARAKKKKNDVMNEEKAIHDSKIREILLNTGYNFEGWRIEKYCNIISAETVLGTGFLSELSLSVNDFFGTTSNTYQSKLVIAKQSVQEKLKAIAVNTGANAIIGIDFDIMTLSNNTLMVSATGTAVVIEKNET